MFTGVTTYSNSTAFLKGGDSRDKNFCEKEEIDYYPFGMLMPNRHGSDASPRDQYKYSFQNQEEDNEVYGSKGTYINYKYRGADTRIGRFFAVDPLAKSFPWNSSYAFSENRVIASIELEGLEAHDLNNGETIYGPYNSDIINTFNSDYDNRTNKSFTKENGATFENYMNFMSSMNSTSSNYSSPSSIPSINMELGANYDNGPYNRTGSDRDGYKSFVEGGTGNLKYNSDNFNADFKVLSYEAWKSDAVGIVGFGFKASMMDLKLDGTIPLFDDHNISIDGSGRMIAVEADVDNSILTGENGLYGYSLGGNLGYYTMEGSVTPALNLSDGFSISGEIGGSVASAHIGRNISIMYDSKNETVSFGGLYNAGIGFGLKAGITITIPLSWFE